MATSAAEPSGQVIEIISSDDEDVEVQRVLEGLSALQGDRGGTSSAAGAAPSSRRRSLAVRFRGRRYSGQSSRRGAGGSHAADVVDLTSDTQPEAQAADPDIVIVSSSTPQAKKKRRHNNSAAASSSAAAAASPSGAVVIKCPVCLDAIKDMTSTTCGHVFCKPCILAAIKSQKKCPTCRKCLTSRNLHRIYL